MYLFPRYWRFPLFSGLWIAKTASDEGCLYSFKLLKKNLSFTFFRHVKWSGLGSISPTFYEQLLHTQINKAQKRQSSCQSFLCFQDLPAQKLFVEHWWNWPLGSISPRCLCDAFMFEDPKSTKRQSSCQCLFALWESSCIKAVSKMLVKLIPLGERDVQRNTPTFCAQRPSIEASQRFRQQISYCVRKCF
jgi:hypothetical protein